VSLQQKAWDLPLD